MTGNARPELLKAIRFVESIPGWSDREPRWDDVDTVEELLDLPWVKSTRGERGFWRFSITEDTENLMAEYDGGRRWWVIGTILTKRGVGADVSSLPTWKGP